MRVGWKIGTYIGIASGAGILALITLYVIIRYYMKRSWKHKKGHTNGIVGQLNLPDQVPDFTIPLMLPMFVQSKLRPDGELFDPLIGSLGENEPSLVQPEDEDFVIVDNELSGPVIRRLESVMDVSMFPEQENDEHRPEATGPWTSSRRESLFFPSLFGVGGLSSVRGALSSTGSDSAPSSPSKFERRFTEKRVRTLSNSSNPSDQSGPIRSRISSDAASIKRKTTKPALVKKTSCPESTMSSKLQQKKFFGDAHRRQLSTDSLLSVKSSKELPASKRGNLAFTMKYDEERKTLVVHLINATDLPMKNNNLLDTFARLYLIMPSKQFRQHSKVHKKTCNPIYDENFAFEDIDKEELLQSHLRIKILQKDGFSRGEMIGELSVNLSEGESITGDMIHKTLLPRAKSVTEDGPGELLVSVCHHATTAQLKVLVIKMRDLPKSCKNSSVSVELVYQDELLQRQQTRSKKHRKKPDFNEELVFHIPTSSSNPLENYSLQFSIFTQDILKGAVCIGYVTLGLDAPRESEVEHWKAVVASPHKPITAMHKFHRTPV